MKRIRILEGGLVVCLAMVGREAIGKEMGGGAAGAATATIHYSEGKLSGTFPVRGALPDKRHIVQLASLRGDEGLWHVETGSCLLDNGSGHLRWSIEVEALRAGAARDGSSKKTVLAFLVEQGRRVRPGSVTYALLRGSAKAISPSLSFAPKSIPRRVEPPVASAWIDSIGGSGYVPGKIYVERLHFKLAGRVCRPPGTYAHILVAPEAGGEVWPMDGTWFDRARFRGVAQIGRQGMDTKTSYRVWVVVSKIRLSRPGGRRQGIDLDEWMRIRRHILAESQGISVEREDITEGDRMEVIITKIGGLVIPTKESGEGGTEISCSPIEKIEGMIREKQLTVEDQITLLALNGRKWTNIGVAQIVDHERWVLHFGQLGNKNDTLTLIAVAAKAPIRDFERQKAELLASSQRITLVLDAKFARKRM